MFVSTASAAANVNVKRVYASIYALDEGRFDVSDTCGQNELLCIFRLGAGWETC